MWLFTTGRTSSRRINIQDRGKRTTGKRWKGQIRVRPEGCGMITARTGAGQTTNRGGQPWVTQIKASFPTMLRRAGQDLDRLLCASTSGGTYIGGVGRLPRSQDQQPNHVSAPEEQGSELRPRGRAEMASEETTCHQKHTSRPAMAARTAPIVCPPPGQNLKDGNRTRTALPLSDGRPIGSGEEIPRPLPVQGFQRGTRRICRSRGHT